MTDISPDSEYQKKKPIDEIQGHYPYTYTIPKEVLTAS